VTTQDAGGRAAAWRLTARRRTAAARVRLGPLMPALRLAGFVAAVAIVVYMGVRAAREVHPRDLRAWPLALAVVAAGTWWLLLARGWSLLVAGGTTRRDVSVWCRTQALRFVPGGIWAPASRATMVRGGAIDKLSAVAGENLGALCAALTIGGLGLAASGRPWWIALVAALPVPWAAARLLRGRMRITPARTVRVTANDALAFAAYAVAAVLVQTAVSGWTHPLAVAGAAAVAWAVGLIVVFVPSGVGVREVVYVGLLAGVLPSAQLSAGAVTMRLAMIAAELGVLLVAGRPPRAEAGA
jgi:hypothetical protein